MVLWEVEVELLHERAGAFWKLDRRVPDDGRRNLLVL